MKWVALTLGWLRGLAKPLSCLFLAGAVGACCHSGAGTDPYAIFQAHYQAIGGLERLKTIRTTQSSGNIRYDGLEGTFRCWSETPLRYRQDEDFGVMQQSEGDDGQTRWQQDANGQVVEIRDEQTLIRRRLGELLERFEHLNPASPYFHLSYLGTTEIDGRSCYQLRLSNSLNEDVTLFFIAAESWHLIKTVVRQPDIEVHTRFDDFRWADGFLIPFHQYSDIRPRNKSEEIWLQEYRVNPAIDQKQFAVPEPAPDRVRFATGDRAENIPFIFAENQIYLPVTIGDDTRLWLLDSGASKSVIDSDYALRLGLKPAGRIGGFGFGDLFELALVKLPPFQVDSITLSGQTIHAFKGLAAGSYEPVRYGILGFDFLSHFVTRIDFANQTVSFFRPEQFSYTGPGVMIEAPLQYGTFTVPACVDGSLCGRFSLDLGAHQSSFHYPFAENHRLLERPGVETVSKGMSGYNFERIVPFQTLQIGPFRIDHPRFCIPQTEGQGATAVGELAGNLGNSLLRHFVLYLDYPQQRVIFERGEEFNHPFAEDKSGMLIGLSEQDQPMVSFVAKDSPSSEAGLMAGDLIEAVDNRAVEQYGGAIPLRNLLRQKAGTRISFTVLRGEQSLTRVIELRDLFRTEPEGL
ncbi:MAG: aspartyl protease family protein [Desulfuromonadaceae bacterium]